MGIGRRLSGYDSDDFGLQAQGIPGGDHPANSRTEPDRHIRNVDAGNGPQEFQTVGGHSAHQQPVKRWHQMQFPLTRQGLGMFAGRLKIVAVLDQFDA